MPTPNDTPNDTPDAAVVRKLLEALSDLRIDDALSMLSPDLLLEFPFRYDGGKPSMQGEAALRFIKSMPKLFKTMNFIEITVHGSTTSGVVAAEYRSNGLTHGGDAYGNTYAGFFDVKDGKITRWREYYDPVVIANTFKLKVVGLNA